VPVRINQVIGAVLETARDRAEAKGLQLSMGSGFDGVIIGDPTRLRQILFNLIGNAVKFTAKGKIHVNCRVENEELFVEVSDSGIGVPEEMRDRLFKDFSQVDVTINRRFGGSGLGLAICHRIVTGLRGEIGVRELSPHGSCFWFRIPVALATEEPASDQSEAPLARPRGRLSGRVLLAEDNSINRTVAVEMLQRLGVSVATAVDGAQAVQMATENAFSAILMDVQMPGTDGLTAAKMLRQQGCETPIIALTSNAMSSDRLACLAAGMNDFVAKPINRTKLEAALRDCLSRAPLNSAVGGEPADRTNFIDTDARLTLGDDLGQPLLDDLTSKFCTDTSEMIERSELLLRSGDTEELIRDLHSLKGVAGTLGMTRIARTAQQLERALRDGNSIDLSSLAHDLKCSQSELAAVSRSERQTFVSA